MNCLSPTRIWLKDGGSDGMLVPCGLCMDCRIRKQREWSLRMLHELSVWEDSCFLTLTYSDNYLPENNTLKKSHLQKWFKRLRKALEPRKIKYFACGEYGDEMERPHYHAIIYGLGLSPIDKQFVIDTWTYCDWSVPAIKKNSFGLVEPQSIAYVAGYIQKKLIKDDAEEVYGQTGRISPFRLCSNGIGSNYAEKNCDQITNLGYITQNGIKHSIPRYYLKRLGIKPDKTLGKVKDCEEVEHYTGLKISADDYYRTHGAADVMKLSQKLKSAKNQHERNLKAKCDRQQTKL